MADDARDDHQCRSVIADCRFATISTPEGKRRYVRRLFATIADRYDFITRFLSYGQDRRWKRRLIRLAALQPAIACSIWRAEPATSLFAAAPHVQRPSASTSRYRMLQLRREPAERVASRSQASLSSPATCSRCRFRDASFDVVTTGYGLRNVPDLDAGAAGNPPRARAGRPAALARLQPPLRTRSSVRSYLRYLTIVGSALGLALHRDPDTYRYIPESIRNYPGAHGVARHDGAARVHRRARPAGARRADGDSRRAHVRVVK